jgi:hypothetical protein
MDTTEEEWITRRRRFPTTFREFAKVINLYYDLMKLGVAPQ